MSDKYMCPACGFKGLDEPPYNENNEASYEVCPCCGFEFGFDNDGAAGKYNNFRLNWIKNGANWLLPDKKPKDWDLNKQLENLKI